MNIILASKSPRRKELLHLMGLEFTVITADIDETMNTQNSIEDEVKRVSLEKALAVKSKVNNDDVIISADTVVVCDNEVMCKPECRNDAIRMLKKLSGKTHKVMTGISVVYGGHSMCDTVVTDVTFRNIDDYEITNYVDMGEPMDKAGAYGIQGKASVFVSKIDGDFYNVVGLPVCKLSLMLKEIEKY